MLSTFLNINICSNYIMIANQTWNILKYDYYTDSKCTNFIVYTTIQKSI